MRNKITLEKSKLSKANSVTKLELAAIDGGRSEIVFPGKFLKDFFKSIHEPFKPLD